MIKHVLSIAVAVTILVAEKCDAQATSWEVHQDGENCWAYLPPSKTEAQDKKGRNVKFELLGPGIWVNFTLGKDFVEFAYSGGYKFDEKTPVVITTSSKSFEIFSEGYFWAWAKDEKTNNEILKVLSNNSELTLSGRSRGGANAPGGLTVKQTYILKGASAAIKETARQCGAKMPEPSKKQSTTASTPPRKKEESPDK
jgi:hypothetical protein